jgi:tetratricopeptide (TPR) repeat protein
MRTAPARLLTLAVLTLPHAAHAGGWKCPARGGREWREVRSEHFRLVTDASSGKAKELVVELESLHLAVRSSLFRTPPPLPGVVQVVAFKDDDDFSVFAPEDADAYYLQVDGDPTVVMTTTFGPYTRIIVAHELTHHLLGRVFARQPRWFAEGLASYLETIGGAGEFTEEDFAKRSFLAPGTYVVGAVPKHRYARVHPWTGGLGEVLAAKGQLADTRAYGLAWSLVFYLIQTRPKEFGDLQGRFARGQDPDAAWLEVFPQWNPGIPDHMAALDDEVGSFLARGRIGTRQLQITKPEPRLDERPLSPGGVHAVRLALPRLGLAEAKALETFRAERDEALSEDPGHVFALRSLAGEKGADGPALAVKATTAHPESGRAWRFAGAVARKPEEREAAYRKAVELEPDDEVALNDLAWHLVQTEREGEALPLARKACSLAPWSSAALDTLAAALQGLGQCPDALQTQRRAVDLLPERLNAEGRKPYLERLSALEASCGPRKATATAPAGSATPVPAATPDPAPPGRR